VEEVEEVEAVVAVVAVVAVAAVTAVAGFKGVGDTKVVGRVGAIESIAVVVSPPPSSVSTPPRNVLTVHSNNSTGTARKTSLFFLPDPW